MQKRSQTRIGVYYFLMLVFSVLFLAITSEIMARLLVSEETFWPINNIYRSVDTPGVSYTLKANFEGTAFGVGLKTNSLGYRGPEWQLEKPTGTFRIALIGDSHAFGYGVPFKDSVGEKLAEKLNERGDVHYEVLNLAINAYNSLQELAVLREYALQYDPDLVIVIASSNDHDPTPIVDQQGMLYGGFDSNIQHLDESIKKIQPKEVSWLTQHSHLLLYLHLLKKKYQLAQEAQTQRDAITKTESTDNCWLGPFPSGLISERLEKSVYIPLKAMIYEVKKQNIPIIIANFNALLDYRQLFEKLSKDEQVPTLELLALFPEACSWPALVEQFSLGWNNHLNAIAHQRWAVALAELIEKQGNIKDEASLEHKHMETEATFKEGVLSLPMVKISATEFYHFTMTFDETAQQFKMTAMVPVASEDKVLATFSVATGVLDIPLVKATVAPKQTLFYEAKLKRLESGSEWHFIIENIKEKK